jgi:hypothetical protein
LEGDWSYTIAVAPITTPADPDWKSKEGSLAWSCDTALFNQHVGWKVCGWHWSVVKNGGLEGAGDVEDIQEAMQACLKVLPAKFLRKHPELEHGG